MIRILFIFLLLLVSVVIGIQLQKDPGYLLISIHHWTLETTLWVAVVGFLLLLFSLHLLLLLFHKIVHFPKTWRHWLAKRRSHNARATTRQGLIEFSEGYWKDAANHLIKALPDSDAPLLNYLTAARAAQEMGDSKLRDDYLRQAQQSMPEAKIAVELTQAQLQLANRQWEQALATLKHLQALAPHHPYVLKLLMQLYEEVKDWPQIINLLPELKRNRVMTDHAFQNLQQNAYLQTMIDLIKQDQLQVLNNFVHKLPKNLTHNVKLMTEYCEYLLTKQADALAESILRRCLRKKFDEKLIEIYGQTKTNASQLRFAESFLKEYPHSPALLLCLGRLSKKENLWGKAKIYFEQSIEFGATPTAYLELGKLLEQLSDHPGASHAYREGLLLSNQS